MIVKLPAPRLLPVTITTLSLLLVVKCGVLVQAAVADGHRPDGVMVAAANAADAQDEHPRRAPINSPPLSPPPADPAKGKASYGATPPRATPPQAVAPQDPTQAAAAQPLAGAAPTPISDSEKAILQDLRKRRKEIETREGSLSVRESVLTASEQRLGAQVDELQALQKKLEGMDAARKQKVEDGWLAMVKLYEAMKPKDAAVIFNDLSMPVLLQLIDHMKDAKAAAVMSAMNPDRAREVTSELAQLRTSPDAAPDQEAAQRKPSPSGG